MRKLLGIVLVSALLLIAVKPGTTLAFANRLTVNSGYRLDNLRWNIAGDLNGQNPNVLSELTWKKIRIFQLTANVNTALDDKVYLLSSLGYGWIFNGPVQDSDYYGDNRSEEFWRSNNKTIGDNSLNAAMALGYELTPPTAGLQISTLVGYSSDSQKLRMADGNQTIPASGQFNGLNSTYQTNWAGPFLGLKMTGLISSKLRISGQYEHHQANYSAFGNWNLRSDLAHPKSFAHKAEGVGDIIALGLDYSIGGDWFFKFNTQFGVWSTSPGLDQVFSPEGISEITRLNEVNWRSATVSFTVNRYF